MLSTDGNKPAGKQRNRKKKAGQPARISATASEQPAISTDQLQEAWAEISKEIAVPAIVAEHADVPAAEITPAEIAPYVPPVAGDAGLPLGPQAVADAWRGYVARSLDQAFAFVGELAAARSPADVFRIQMAYAAEACETFLTEAGKIGDLQSELVRQRAMRFEGLVARITQTTFELRAVRH